MRTMPWRYSEKTTTETDTATGRPAIRFLAGTYSGGGNPSTPSSSWTPSVFSTIETSVYWPTVNTRSYICFRSSSSPSAFQVASPIA